MAKKQESYAEAIQELQNIMERIENENIDINNLLSDVKRAAELIKYCKAKLFDTNEEIVNILDKIQ